jgi:hypothetical protein
VALAAAESFVKNGRSDAQAPKRPKIEPEVSSEPLVPSTRGVLARADGREVRRLTLYLPVELAKRLAIHCAEHDRDLSDVVSEAVAKQLEA